MADEKPRLSEYFLNTAAKNRTPIVVEVVTGARYAGVLKGYQLNKERALTLFNLANPNKFSVTISYDCIVAIKVIDEDEKEIPF